jgi:hypothetical protein
MHGSSGASRVIARGAAAVAGELTTAVTGAWLEPGENTVMLTVFPDKGYAGRASATLKRTLGDDGSERFFYPQNPAIYLNGSAVMPNVPVNGSSFSGYSVAPALPAGIMLDADTGTITGLPSEIRSESVYAVSAVNKRGGGLAGTQLTLSVIDGVMGSLSYTENPATYSTGMPIAPNDATLSLRGPALFTVTPALPAGLVLDKATGRVSGTPSAASALIAYTVTAVTNAGLATVALGIAVTPGCAGSCAPPAPDGFLGPVSVTRASGTASPPACSGGFATSNAVPTLWDTPSAAAATCECTCTTVCDWVHLAYMRDNSDCSDAPVGSITPALPGSFTCGSVVGPGRYFRLNGDIPAKCTNQASAVSKPPIAWAAALRLCAPSASESGVCAASADQCFPTKIGDLCIYAETADPTNVACPSSYPNKETRRSSFNDERSCDVTGCQCSTPGCSHCNSTNTSAGCTCNATPAPSGRCPLVMKACCNFSGEAVAASPTYAPLTCYDSVGMPQCAFPGLAMYDDGGSLPACNAAGVATATGSVTTAGDVVLCCR